MSSYDDDDDGPGFLSTLLLVGLAGGAGFFLWKMVSGSASAGLSLPNLTTLFTTPPVSPSGNAANVLASSMAPYVQTIASKPSMTQGFELYGDSALAAADAAGVPEDIFLSMITTESAWNPNAVSSAGAVGLAQVLPSTAASPGYGVAPFNAYDVGGSLIGAAQYLAALARVTGSWQAALAAYNGGVGNDAGSAEMAYATTVLNNAGQAATV